MTWNDEDYQPAEGMYPCISIQQPFASFIKFGVKSIELRGWSTKYRGPILIHAGKAWYGQKNTNKASEQIGERNAGILACKFHMPGPDEILTDGSTFYPRGGLVAIAYLVRVAHFTAVSWETLRDAHRSNGPFDPREYGWLLENVSGIEPHVPYPGQQKIFHVPAEMIPADIMPAFTKTV